MDRLECDRMFVAVLDHGGFAKAAQRLGTSSGQASKLVSRLEQELGAQLLKRTTRALAPTEVGQAYYERVKALLQDFDALDASIRNASGAPTGRIRLTAPMTFGTMRLAPILMDFARAFPDIQLDVNFSDRIMNLVDDGYDLAVRIGQSRDSSLIARKLCETGIAVVAAPSYLAAHGEPERIQDLAGHECVIDMNFRDPLVWRFTGQDGTVTPVEVTGRLRFSDAGACLAAAEAGFGIARVPAFVVEASVRAGRVTRILAEADRRTSGVYAVYPPAKHLALKVRTLVDFLARCFREDAP